MARTSAGTFSNGHRLRLKPRYNKNVRTNSIPFVEWLLRGPPGTLWTQIPFHTQREKFILPAFRVTILTILAPFFLVRSSGSGKPKLLLVYLFTFASVDMSSPLDSGESPLHPRRLRSLRFLRSSRFSDRSFVPCCAIVRSDSDSAVQAVQCRSLFDHNAACSGI